MRSDGLLDLYVLRSALEPQQLLIHKLLRQTSRLSELEWLDQVAKGENRSYKALTLAFGSDAGGVLHEYLSAIATHLGDERRWSPCHLVEAVASDIMRLSLRGAAVCHELLVMRSQSFPCVLFRLLQGPGYAQEILELANHSPCLLDAFSRRHLAAFATAEALNSQESLMVLRSTAMLFQGNTYSTETLHSKATRRSKNRITHSMSLHDLAMWYQVSATPSFLRVCGKEEDNLPVAGIRRRGRGGSSQASLS